jgi:hypothetical protein
MTSSQDLTATVHTIICTTLGPYDVNQAIKHGVTRQKAQSGAITFIQRFGSAGNLHLHFRLIVLVPARVKYRNFKRYFATVLSGMLPLGWGGHWTPPQPLAGRLIDSL